MSDFNNILYSKNFNKATASFSKKSGILYIEDITDLDFWKLFFDGKYEIKVFQNEKNRYIAGKGELKKLYEKCNKYFLIAVDSDYDYLCENRNDCAYKMCNNPFIIHTYSYSRESVIYNSGYIDFILQKLAFYGEYLNFKSDVYLRGISNLIFPLLVERLFIIENNPQNSEQHISALNKCLGEILERNEKNIYEALESSTDCIIKEDYFKSLEPMVYKFLDTTLREKMEAFVLILEEKGLNKDNAYRFINGHILEDKIILPFMGAVHKKRKEYESDRFLNYGESQNLSRKGQIHNYFNDNCNIKTLLVHHIEKIMNMNDPILNKILERVKNLDVSLD